MPSGPLTLAELEVGEEAKILSIEGPGFLRRKLIYMGLYPGTTVRVFRKGPAGNPVGIIVDDVLLLAVRRKDAQFIKVRRKG